MPPSYNILKNIFGNTKKNHTFVRCRSYSYY
nr:MAG TPA: hypothetical protein [Microviridae sp.]